MKSFILLIALTGAVAGCATPQAALDHANHGAGLTAALHSELRKFREVQVRIATSRIDTIRQQELRITEYKRSTLYNDRLAQAAGNTDDSALYRTMTGLVDSIAADEAAEQQRVAQVETQLRALLQPLPDAATKLAPVQKALAAMGAELSAAQRLKIVTEFASDVKSDIDKVRDAAEEESKKAPVQASPATDNQ